MVNTSNVEREIAELRRIAEDAVSEANGARNALDRALYIAKEFIPENQHAAFDARFWTVPGASASLKLVPTDRPVIEADGER